MEGASNRGSASRHFCATTPIASYRGNKRDGAWKKVAQEGTNVRNVADRIRRTPVHRGGRGSSGGSSRVSSRGGLGEAGLTPTRSTPGSTLPGPGPSREPTLGPLGQQMPAPTSPFSLSHFKDLGLPAPIHSCPGWVCFFGTKAYASIAMPTTLSRRHSWAAHAARPW